MIFRRMALGAVLAVALVCGGSQVGVPGSQEGEPAGAAAPGTTALPTITDTPPPETETKTETKTGTGPGATPEPRELDKKALDQKLSTYLAGRASGAGIMVMDRTTGRSYGFRRNSQFVTASVAKLDILLTLLLKRQKAGKGLSADEQYDTKIMIRESDNKSADRNFVRAGSATGVNTANRRSFGLKDTTAIDASCLDLLCWSLTSTTPADQVRLLQKLFTGPLNEANRKYALDLMRTVVKEQRWGVSAGALNGDVVYNKNGWMTHQRDGERWAVNSVGRVEGHGHDLLVAVMTNHNPSMGYGITTAEHLVREVAEAFRATTGE